MQNRALWFIFRPENALHSSIENLEIDVLSLGFIISSLGLGVVSKLGVLAQCLDVEIYITSLSLYNSCSFYEKQHHAATIVLCTILYMIV